MWKRRSTSLVPSGIGQLTLYHCQKKIRTKEGNSSDVIDLITLSNIDDTARDTGRGVSNAAKIQAQLTGSQKMTHARTRAC